MHLLFAANDAYIPHVATTLASIFENNKDLEFDVHVMVTDISNVNEKKLKDFVDSYHHTLEIKVVDENTLDIDISICGKWGIFPSLKLYAVDFFPNVNKILYLDADMICIGSLRNIEDLDLDSFYLAMSSDEEGSMNHKKRLEIPQNAFYGCAGLMYLNLKAWRKDNVRDKCMQYFNDPSNREIIKWGEQDVINKVCLGKILELPIEFNIFSHYYLHHQQAIPQKYRSCWEQHKQNAIMIHYIDACKPWFKDCMFPLKKYYWKYHKLTPWKHESYGYSNVYEGLWQHVKNKIKAGLHLTSIKKYHYGYDI